MNTERQRTEDRGTAGGTGDSPVVAGNLPGTPDSQPSTPQPSTARHSEHLTAAVKNWFPDRGYGFLFNPEGGPDIFLHARNLVRPRGQPAPVLFIGDTVQFQLVENDKGLNAVEAIKLP